MENLVDVDSPLYKSGLNNWRPIINLDKGDFTMVIHPVKFELINELMKDKNKETRLLGFAISLFKSVPTSERYLEPYDLISNAYTKLLDGSRSWDTEKHTDAFIKVIEIMKSEYLNYLSKHKEDMLGDDEVCEVYNERTSESYEYFYELDENKNLRTYKNEYDYKKNSLINKCRKELLLAGKIQEVKVYDMWLLGHKNQRMAKELGISVKDVSNAKRRIIEFFKDKSDLKDAWINL